MTTATALAQLRDAIRAELVAEFVEKLDALQRSNDEDNLYLDGWRNGVEDSIATIQEG